MRQRVDGDSGGRRGVVFALVALCVAVLGVTLALPELQPTTPMGRPGVASALASAVVFGEQVEVPDAAARSSVEVPVVGGDGTRVLLARLMVRPFGQHDLGSDDDVGVFARGVPVECFADDRHVPRDDVHGWRVSSTPHRVRFEAAGYRPVTCNVPAPGPGMIDLGQVVFEPDAELLVRVVGAPIDGVVRVSYGMSRGASTTERFAAAPLQLFGGAGEVVVPTPSQADLVVGAELAAGDDVTWFAVESVDVRLASGERRVVELRAIAAVRVEVRVHGPSPLLSPWLVSRVESTSAAGAPRPAIDCSTKCTDADGRAVFLVAPGRYRFGLDVHGAWQPLRSLYGRDLVEQIDRDVVLDFEPVESLVGVQVREGGNVCPSLVKWRGVADGRIAGDATLCTVLLRRELDEAPALLIWTAAGGTRQVRRDALRFDGDMVSIDGDAATALATLRVLADIPDDVYHQQLGVVAESLDGGAALRIGGNRAPFEAQLPAGDYRLAWRCSGAPGPEIATSLHLVGGETHELRATPPVLQAWTGRVTDLAVLGPLANFALVRMGDGWPLGGASDGVLPFRLVEPPQLGAAAVLYLHSLKVELPAHVAAIDVGARTFQISHDITAADLVHVSSRGLGDGERRIELRSELPDTRIAAHLGAQFDLPMAPGSERRGCLLEKIDGTSHVIAWFSVRHGMRQLLVEPRGHWAMVRLESAGMRASVAIEGDPGMDPITVVRSNEAAGRRELRVYVADGTTAVHVDLHPRDRVTFAPDETEMVVR